MKTTEEIYSSSLQLINKLMTLKMNVFNGCRADIAELNETEKRLPNLIEWARNNDKISDIRHYLQSGKFNTSSLHFYANELAEKFI